VRECVVETAQSLEAQASHHGSRSPRFIPPIEDSRHDDFVDNGHFSVKGVAKFALMLLSLIKSHCN
jgi:hypothetical protein